MSRFQILYSSNYNPNSKRYSFKLFKCLLFILKNVELMQKQVQQSPAVTPQLYYFRSYAILNWVQNNLSQAIFLFFPLSYTILSSQLHYFPLLSPQLHYLFPLVKLFFLFSPQLSYLPPISNSVAAKIAQDIL